MKLHAIKLLIAILMASFMYGCSSGKIVKTYEGEEVKDQAVLTAPENIIIRSVNGERVPKYLLSGLNVRYGLKPGANVVEFQYESVWAKSKRDDKDDARAENIESERREVLINVLPGVGYTFKFRNAENVRDAKELAANFDAEIIDQKTQQTVAVSGDVGSHSSAIQLAQPVVLAPVQSGSVSVASATVTSPSVAAPAVPSVAADIPVQQSVAVVPAVQAELPTLDGLKIMWESATAEEKKAFLKWAFK